MVTKRIETVEIKRPERIDGIVEEAFVQNERWRNQAGFLNDIIGTFKEALTASVGYDDYNRPDEEVVDHVDIGEISFGVATKPTRKNPCYENVETQFKTYVNHLREEKYRTNVKSIFTHDGVLYVSIGLLVDKLNEYIQKATVGKEGISQSVVCVKGTPTEAPAAVRFVVGKDYSALTESNARDYLKAVAMKAHGDAVAKEFKGKIMRDSLGVLGKTPEELEQPETVLYAFENYGFYNQMEPRAPPKYREVIDALIKPIGLRITKASKIGDLIVFGETGGPLEGTLREKGLLTDELVGLYDAKIVRGEPCVGLYNIGDVVQQYEDASKSKTIEQNITMTI